MSIKRLRATAGVFLAGICLTIDAADQTTPGKKYPRAELPHFDREEVERIFFKNVFDHVVGNRPESGAPAQASPPGPTPAHSAGEAGASEPRTAWSRIISPVTIEDEVKSLKLDLDRVVTTPGEFAGRGHRAARLDFSLLSMLFAIIDQYDADVRWKESAAQARSVFARTAANLKAGGSVQVYNEAKLRKQDLDDLVRGSRLSAGDRGKPTTEDEWVDRSSLMQLLETRMEANLGQWTGSAEEFRARSDKIRHEAEIVAAIGTFLLSKGMDDADDEQYRRLARSLAEGGSHMAEAARSGDEAAAGRAMTEISRSCTDCHEEYR